jgi:hypothetical protein
VSTLWNFLNRAVQKIPNDSCRKSDPLAQTVIMYNNNSWAITDLLVTDRCCHLLQLVVEG